MGLLSTTVRTFANLYKHFAEKRPGGPVLPEYKTQTTRPKRIGMVVAVYQNKYENLIEKIFKRHRMCEKFRKHPAHLSPNCITNLLSSKALGNFPPCGEATPQEVGDLITDLRAISSRVSRGAI